VAKGRSALQRQLKGKRGPLRQHKRLNERGKTPLFYSFGKRAWPFSTRRRRGKELGRVRNKKPPRTNAQRFMSKKKESLVFMSEGQGSSEGNHKEIQKF